MRFVSRRLLAVVVAIAFLGLTPVTAGATDQEEVERAEAARREAYERLVTVNAELDAALLRYNEINAELDSLVARIEVIEERIAVAEVDMAEMQERAEELVTEAYMAAGGSLLELAFEAESLQDMLTSQALLDRAADADLLELNRLDAVTRETDRLRHEVEQDRRRVEQLGVEAAAVVEDLEDLREERDAEYRRTDEAARQAREEFEEAERARKLAEAAAARGSAGGVGAISGFVCPLPGASFINDWGFPRSGGRGHQGTDMFAAHGTPVLASGNGTVSHRFSSLGGTTAYVTTGSAMYYYAHLSGYAEGAPSGSHVGAGQVIGFVGNTGNAVGASPHLHFEIHPGGGSAVNPYPTLVSAC
jgi:murein DD-endopeptidase MepM/ murein hydrolase activator NlpD